MSDAAYGSANAGADVRADLGSDAVSDVLADLGSDAVSDGIAKLYAYSKPDANPYNRLRLLLAVRRKPTISRGNREIGESRLEEVR